MSYAGKGNSYTANEPSLGVYWVVPAAVFPNAQRTVSPASAPYGLNGGSVQNVSGVSLIAPGTKYQDRWNQLDMSVKKTFRFNRKQIQPQLALFNALNGNVVLAENEQYGTALPNVTTADGRGQPRNILQGRMLRLAVLFDF
jgi:hypothetical protein